MIPAHVRFLNCAGIAPTADSGAASWTAQQSKQTLALPVELSSFVSV